MDTNKELVARKRNNAQVSIDREWVAEKLAQGFKISDIARELDAERPGYHYTYEMAKYDVHAVKQGWLRSSIMNFQEAKAQQLAKIDALEHQYWQGWFGSREEQVKSTVEEKSGDQHSKRGTPAAQYKHVRKKMDKASQYGDPRFLDGVRQCIVMRIEIFGLKVPDKLEIDWRSEAQKFGIPVQESNDLLDNLVGAFLDAAERGTKTGEDFTSGDYSGPAA